MSRSMFVQYRDRGFWAYDVVLHVFLKHLIDVAAPRATEPEHAWLAEAVAQWRVYACLTDFGFSINEEWSEDRIELVVSLCEEASGKVGDRESIGSEEIKAWPIHDHMRIDPRDEEQVPTRPVVRIGWAIIGLVRGTLGPPPPNCWWFYGLADRPRIIHSR